MNRRQLIKGIGSALCAGAIPPFLPGLIPKPIDFIAALRREVDDKTAAMRRITEAHGVRSVFDVGGASLTRKDIWGALADARKRR